MTTTLPAFVSTGIGCYIMGRGVTKIARLAKRYGDRLEIFDRVAVVHSHSRVRIPYLAPMICYKTGKNCSFVSINKDIISFYNFEQILVKHINRVTKDNTDKHYNKDVSAEDEWSHITEIGPKIEIQDPLEVSQRSIFFSKDKQNATRQEIVQEKSEQVKDQINNTSQYQKFVNVLLKERTNELKKVMENQKRFAEELNCFQETPKNRMELEHLNPKYITEVDTKSLIGTLESEYKKVQERLEHEQSLIEKTKNELQLKRQQIEQLKEELKFIAQKQQNHEIDDPVLIIKHELKKLGIGDESGKIAEALDTLANKIRSNKKI